MPAHLFAALRSLFHALIALAVTPPSRTSAEAAEDFRSTRAPADLIAAGFGKPNIRADIRANISEATPPSDPWALIPDPSPLSPGPPTDTLIGIAASGRTPYVLGAIAHARSVGRLYHRFSLCPRLPARPGRQIAITPDTGPRILTGSTRLKAGTATKLVHNMSPAEL